MTDTMADLMSIAAVVVAVVAVFASSRLIRPQLQRLVVYIRNYIPRARHLQRNRIPPGSLGLPLIGESLQFISSYRSSVRPDTFINDRRLRHGNIFTTHLFGRPTVVSLDTELNRLILNSDGRLFEPEYPTSLKQLWGKWAIIMLSGSLHKRVHGVVATFLKSEEFKDHLFQHVDAVIQQAMDKWKTNATVLVDEETKKISFRVTAKVLLGLDSLDASAATTIEALRAEFHKFISGVVSVPINLPGTSFYSSVQSRARIVQMIKDIIKERESRASVSTLDEGNLDSTVHLDVLNLLMEERSLMNSKVKDTDKAQGNDEQSEATPLEFITDNIVSFFFPSEDSVGMLISLAVKYVSECPKALLQLREENSQFSKRYAGEKLSSRHYLMQLPFTHCVLNESLRLGNIVKGVIRKALVDVEVKDFVIPKGWAVFPFFRGVHLDKDIYKDGDEFNPWRWQERVPLSHFTPFGGGPRYCSGLDMARLEAAVFLHHLVTRFEWELEAKDTLTNFPFVKLAKRLPINILNKHDASREPQQTPLD